MQVTRRFSSAVLRGAPRGLTSSLGGALLAMLLGACGVQQVDAIRQSRHGLANVTTVFDFETGTQGWQNNGQGTACPDGTCIVQAVGQGAGQTEIGPVFEGQGALKYHIANGTTGYFEVAHYPPGGTHEAITLGGAGSNGTVVNLALWLPKGAITHIGAAQAFVKTGPSSTEAYNKQYVGSYALVEDAWTVFGVYIPPLAGADATVNSVGFAFSMNDTTMSDDVYIDSVSYFTP